MSYQYPQYQAAPLETSTAEIIAVTGVQIENERAEFIKSALEKGVSHVRSKCQSAATTTTTSPTSIHPTTTSICATQYTNGYDARNGCHSQLLRPSAVDVSVILVHLLDWRNYSKHHIFEFCKQHSKTIRSLTRRKRLFVGLADNPHYFTSGDNLPVCCFCCSISD